eukprot:jgi/Picre1/33937/NNA_001415.t1
MVVSTRHGGVRGPCQKDALFKRRLRQCESEAEAIHGHMMKISDHMRDMVCDYGATCALVAWLGPQRSIYVSRTGNIGYSDAPDIWASVQQTFMNLLHKSKGIQDIALPRISCGDMPVSGE